MKNLHINDSYNTWSISEMKRKINETALERYGEFDSIKTLLNRTYKSMYIEWWLHNIGYYITKPFCHIESIQKINLRCKDVDLEEWSRS